MHAYIHPYIHTSIHTYTHTHIYTHTSIHTYVHTYIPTYLPTYIHAYMHTLTLHMHTCIRLPLSAQFFAHKMDTFWGHGWRTPGWREKAIGLHQEQQEQQEQPRQPTSEWAQHYQRHVTAILLQEWWRPWFLDKVQHVLLLLFLVMFYG